MRIYADGVWDLFHVGHIRLIQRLKHLKGGNNCVLIGVCSDEFCKGYKRETIISMEQRVDMLRSCKYVDEVIPACPAPITEQLIRDHNIDLVVHADDYNDKEMEKWYKVPRLMNKLHIIPYTSEISTTSIIRVCQDRKLIAMKQERPKEKILMRDSSQQKRPLYYTERKKTEDRMVKKNSDGRRAVVS